MKWIACVLVAGSLAMPRPVVAQTATPTSSFAFDQLAPDLATANSYTYRIYADGSATGTVLAVKCTGTASPFVCVAPVPAFTPGQHSVQLTAANVAGESVKSSPFAFAMVIVPSAPQNLRIQ